jgi:hypothetical protein
MVRSLLNFIALMGFVLLLPFFCLAAWQWGSEDERWLMKVAFCLLSPLCGALWYGIVSRKHFSYLVQVLIIIGGYAGVVWLVRERIITF